MSSWSGFTEPTICRYLSRVPSQRKSFHGSSGIPVIGLDKTMSCCWSKLPLLTRGFSGGTTVELLNERRVLYDHYINYGNYTLQLVTSVYECDTVCTSDNHYHREDDTRRFLTFSQINYRLIQSTSGMQTSPGQHSALWIFSIWWKKWFTHVPYSKEITGNGFDSPPQCSVTQWSI